MAPGNVGRPDPRGGVERASFSPFKKKHKISYSWPCSSFRDEKEEEKAPEEEAEGQADGADAETGQEGQEGQEGSDDGNQEPVIEPNIPIEFQLLFDQSEKEDYISQFTILSTEESISDNEKDGDEDAEEGHEKQHESEEPSSK